ncbi:MAG: anhydro-N-acetylmuramic acid kinase [Gammaproteobacteria bacterium]|jgi:anhydro-N-acetylmuramic acid kinase
MSGYFLGLISGTSTDGVDAALCEFGQHRCRVVAAQTFAYPPAIRERVETLIESGRSDLAEIGALDVAVGRFFADSAMALIKGQGLSPTDVTAIGHHGQTIWHEPDPPEPFSWQIGDPNSVAAITGIDTVADLRRLDMAVGGQGAPIVPAFHEWLFADEGTARVVVNIGGIANLTLLAPGRDVLGFDTGPGNTLLDAWVRRCLHQPYDDGGRWAAGGEPDSELLAHCLDDPYFERAAPKSTGRERFNETWLKQKLAAVDREVPAAAVASTLVELSAQTIADAISRLGLTEFDLIVCGGGVKNATLMSRLGAIAGPTAESSAGYGLDPDWVEAAAMAWLARARIERIPGNLPTVTSAREGRVLGGLYLGAGTRSA